MMMLLTTLASAVLSDYVWHNATNLTLRNHYSWGGAPLPNSFARLPLSAEATVRSPVWSLSTDAAGVQVTFATNASSVALRWRVGESSCPGEATVPIVLCAGADLYEFQTSTQKWRWVATTTKIGVDAGIVGKAMDEQSLYSPPHDGATRSYLLNLPMYNKVLSMEIGVPSPALIRPLRASDPGALKAMRPIVWYGTSITQGAAASRPGAATTNIVSRELGVEVMNFGFSGNGLLEKSVGAYLVQINASAIILDCLHNMNYSNVRTNTEPLVRQLRKARPDTPIVFAEGVPYGLSWLQNASSSRQKQLLRRAEFRAAYDRLVAAGVAGLHYVEGDQLFDSVPKGPLWQPTEAGTHPSDLGMASMAEFWIRYLRRLLAIP